MSRPLDWRTLPLSGRVLIEASAGTGKTYTIGLIVLRLLLETDDGIDALLVCTFTDAAAQELRDRIRARLVDLETRLGAWPPPAAPDDDDELGHYLLERCGEDAADALRRVRLARLDLDRAAIGTIHGFLARVLREQPFLCGGALLAEQLVDESGLIGEAFDDFRRHGLQAPAAQRPPYWPLLQKHADALRGELQQLFNNPDARLLLPSFASADTLFEREAALRMPERIAELRAIAAGETALAWKKNAAFPQDLDVALDALAAGASLLELDGKTLDKVSAEQCGKAVPKSGAAALADCATLHALLDTAELARAIAPRLRAQALHDGWHWCRRLLRERSERRGVASFSQLVERVADALAGANGAALATALSQRYRHALIDEFQDTDQRQFAIFERIYRDADPRTSLHLIGDPKQAIYGFRGGDVEAYLRAARSAGDSVYTLPNNFRSAPSMVAAINALYRECGDGFDHPQIVFREVQARRGGDHHYQGDPSARLLIHVDRRDGNKGALRDAAIDACAAQIAALLADGPATIDGHRPGPGQLAVLLPFNEHVAAMRAALERRGVPCVGAGRQSVLATPIAEELELLLHASLHPEQAGAVRAALGTALLGFDHDALLALDDDPDAGEMQAARFDGWRRLWRERGPLALIEAVQRERAAVELARGDGERRLTDLRHLGELLQDEAPQHPGPAALLQSFRRQRRDALAGDATALDERRLRLESDAARVRLMTLHGCKGLQFDLVFLPLAFDGRAALPALPRFHAADGDGASAPGALCFDLGSAQLDRHRQIAQREELQERLRLLYVALTRAVHACHVFWHPTGDDSAFGRLLTQLAARHGLPSPLDALPQLPQASPTIALLDGWSAPPAHYRPPRAADGPRQSRSDWPGPRPPLWLTSFSALTRHAAEADPGPAADETGAPLTPWPEPASADLALQRLAGLRGLGFGNALHALFERSDPQQPLWPQQRGWIPGVLAEFGVAPGERGEPAIEALARRIDAVRATDLGGGLRLAALPADDAVAEFTFHFPLHGGTLAQLRTVCAAHGRPELVPATLGNQRLDGMMSGAIDLVVRHDGRFHLLDYKSNWLGDRLDHYRADVLERAMNEACYPLQALIYAVALQRHLRRRLPGFDPQHQLGEAIYLFVRAVGLASGAGLWRRRFEPALLAAVDRLFDGAERATEEPA